MGENTSSLAFQKRHTHSSGNWAIWGRNWCFFRGHKNTFLTLEKSLHIRKISSMHWVWCWECDTQKNHMRWSHSTWMCWSEKSKLAGFAWENLQGRQFVLAISHVSLILSALRLPGRLEQGLPFLRATCRVMQQERRCLCLKAVYICIIRDSNYRSLITWSKPICFFFPQDCALAPCTGLGSICLMSCLHSGAAVMSTTGENQEKIIIPSMNNMQ